MTRTADIRDLAAAAVTGTTDAQGNVFWARSWPTIQAGIPVIYFKPPSEERLGLGPNGAPQFTTTATITMVARLDALMKVNDQSSYEVEQALERLKQQIEMAVINYPPLMVLLQQMPFTRADIDVNSEGNKVFGELKLQIGMEFYEGPENFYPITGDAIEEVTVTADLVNVADPSGTYPNPPFPAAVTPAPRTHGPDGRAEGGLDIQFP